MTEKKTRKSSISADEIAAVMAANMVANMADPNFDQERERMLQEAADKALRTHEKDLANAGIIISKKKTVDLQSKTGEK